MKVPHDWKKKDLISAKRLGGMSQAIRELQRKRGARGRSGRRGGGTSSCVAWRPTLRNAGTVMSPDWRVTFAFGTVNGVAPTNWDTEFAIATPANDYWPTLTIATSNGEITGITLSLETTVPTDDSVTADAPPTSFEFPLGIISNLSPCMLFTTDLTATSGEVFRASKGSLSFAGEEPFTRYWAWTISV